MLNKLLSILKNNIYPISLYCRQISGTVVLLFLTRFLSVYDYGIFTSYKAQATFLLLFVNLGYNEYILVSSKKNIKDVQLKIGFFIINATITMALIIFISTFFNIESKYLFLLVLIRTFLDGTFFSLMLPYFQAAKKFEIISFVNIFYSIVMIIITLIAYVFKFSLVKFLWCNIILGVINFTQVSFYAKINYLLVLSHLKELFKRLDKSLFAYIGVVLCSYLYVQIPALYISMYVDKELAALYFSASTISSIIMLLIVAQVQKILPELIKVSIDISKKILKKNMLIINGINIIILIFFILFGKSLLLMLYGQTYYSNAYFVLLLLTLSNISIATASIYGAYITASGNQHIKIKMQIEAIIICVVTLLLFHKFGIYAATFAYLLSATHIGVRYVIKTKQLLKFHNK